MTYNATVSPCYPVAGLRWNIPARSRMSSVPSLPVYRCGQCQGQSFRLFAGGVARETLFVECTACHLTSRIEPKAQLVLSPSGSLVIASGGGGGAARGP
jgi:hypothetical protein